MYDLNMWMVFLFIITITFISYAEYNWTYQIQKCNIIEHNIKEHSRSWQSIKVEVRNEVEHGGSVDDDVAVEGGRLIWAS